ncbi:toprim domain-containing protein [Ktedonospora formicarum]|uniref:Toprim domain-containing protein n=1 Tax=Ktedonospora formicarum TaxID=2778364 RepID=A0A8J3MUC0_9CHLR|nr:toprim domain-containing protein [Ktedonospora formicarum]GHO49167.1 hypothetical protein KSX_73300 [Ktedonospora formicarum]
MQHVRYETAPSTPTRVVTRRGTQIEIISVHDLWEPLQRGAWLRAFCHLHGGDRQRSLSVNRENGWGQCFNCHARVLVREFNPDATATLLRGHTRFSPPTPSAPPVARPARPQSLPNQQGQIIPLSQTTPRTRASTAAWQRQEVASLLHLHGLLGQALTSFTLGDSWQAQAYLEARHIPLDIAAATGVGYLPHELATRQASGERLLQRWVDRLLFPLTAPEGRGYIGRSLWRWQTCLDENVHKALLEDASDEAPKRWIKTNPAGWFSEPPVQWAEHVIIVEGPFDRLALLAAGFAPHEVVAVVSTSLCVEWLPDHLCSVLLALDGDTAGREAARRLQAQIKTREIHAELCSPPRDGRGKDWSERYCRCGTDGLEALYASFALLQHNL